MTTTSSCAIAGGTPGPRGQALPAIDERAAQDWQRALRVAAAHWADALREQYQLVDSGRADTAARMALGADYSEHAARRWLDGVTAFRQAHFAA